nr:transposase, MuDR, MULE transposase domain protein [Tanacetum cinerariifolium]
RHVEDLQLGVESYQKKLNLTKLDMYQSDLKRMEAYTAYSNPRGFIYQNKDKKNRLIQIDEFHKFSDGTLTDVRNALDDRLKRIRMKYLPQSIWRKSDKDRASAMIQAIDKRLKTRRIMRSLERYKVVRYRYSNPMIQPELEVSTQGYPLVSVEVLRSILMDLQVTPTKPGRMTKPYSSHRFIASCFNDETLRWSDEVLKLENFKKDESKNSQVIQSRKIRTFLNCLRPLLIIDASHLKGLYKGTNLVAVGMDRNNQIVPIAFGICKGETGPCWSWWMSTLKKCISDNPNFLFISDRHPAIALAVHNEFPLAFHAKATGVKVDRDASCDGARLVLLHHYEKFTSPPEREFVGKMVATVDPVELDTFLTNQVN